jgi:uncharacterized protein YndB with AHSA1/START domain
MPLGTYAVTGEIVIVRTPEDVFDFVSDPENDPRWCGLVPKVSFTGDRTTGLGTYTFTQLVPRSDSIQGSGEILALERPTSLRSRSTFDGAALETTFDLRPQGGATRFQHTNRVTWSGRYRLLHPYLKRLTRRYISDQLDALKELLEAE